MRGNSRNWQFCKPTWQDKANKMDARPKQMFFIPEALLVAASSYMFFLCFVHTNIFAVSNYVIMACETLFLGLAASYILLVRKKPDIILIAFALLVYFCVLWIFRGVSIYKVPETS